MDIGEVLITKNIQMFVYLATYYCYELTSIQHRSYFYNKIDAMYCPVFNPDTYYFNNIAESIARDMHCYFILGNVSHYGDSRVTQPTTHVNMNMLRVKGGNTLDNQVSVLSTVIDVEGLRNFQKKSIFDQKTDGSFKQTPPGYTIDGVIKREYTNRFIYNCKDWTNDFLMRLSLSNMEY